MKEQAVRATIKVNRIRKRCRKIEKTVCTSIGKNQEQALISLKIKIDSAKNYSRFFEYNGDIIFTPVEIEDIGGVRMTCESLYCDPLAVLPASILGV